MVVEPTIDYLQFLVNVLLLKRLHVTLKSAYGARDFGLVITANTLVFNVYWHSFTNVETLAVIVLMMGKISDTIIRLLEFSAIASVWGGC